MAGDKATRELRGYFDQLMANSSKDQNVDMIAVVAVKNWQSGAMCCGSLSPSDWRNKTLRHLSDLTLQGYPASCCCKSEDPAHYSNFTCTDSELIHRAG